MHRARSVQLLPRSSRRSEAEVAQDLFHGNLGAEYVEVDTWHRSPHLYPRLVCGTERGGTGTLVYWGLLVFLKHSSLATSAICQLIVLRGATP